jgi:hypothetical protein
MPGARWRPLADNWATQPRMTRFDLVIIHTAVGSFDGTYSYFRTGNGAGYGGTESHFMTSGAGDIDQYQDTAHQAEANGAANARAISVENADMGPQFAPWNTNDGNAVPAFTAQQIEANARICAWAHTTHGIPLEPVPDSKPGRRGIGYHRLGVPGYAVTGGELWSSARGKVCPGPKRIAQIPQIIARARQIVGGAQTQEVPDLDATQARQLDEVHRMLTGRFAPGGRNLGDLAIETFHRQEGYGRRIENAEARVIALEAAVAALAENAEITADEIEDAVAKALRDNVVRVDVDVTGTNPT